MAEKKKKTIASRATNSAKNSSKKNTNTTKEQGSGEQKIPTRLISSSVFLGLFILFIVVFFNCKSIVFNADRMRFFGFFFANNFAYAGV